MSRCNEHNYYCTLVVGSIRIEQLTKPTIWSRIKAWIVRQDQLNRKLIERQIAEEAEGDLVDTMRGLE